ncbi:MAG TPA: glutamate formimidoyltransferase [Vicinamibacteria bacterium]
MVAFSAGTKLIELVPNVSEGRSEKILDEIGASFAKGEGCWLLDRHQDPSHHRAVLTAAATIESVVEASRRLMERALARIDLRTQRGVHPRIGALDVLPLVPLRESTSAEARDLARKVGAALAESFEIPVFLYADAAARAEHRELAFLRRGGFEALAARMAASELVPDFGPHRPHPTGGAVAVGARFFLIAYNLELSTDEVSVARAVARRLRESGGGLPQVRALGFALSNPPRAQVSMNLRDYRVTSLMQAFEAVNREAKERGLEIVRSEIVGLIPEAAAFDGMVERLKLDKSPGILEERMRGAGLLT